MKYLLLFFATVALGMTHPDNFASYILDFEQLIDTTADKKTYTSRLHHRAPNVISALTDEKNRVVDDFSVTAYFKDSVYFWFSIYTEYTSKYVVIHDKDNLGLIYRVLDFEELHKSNLNIFTKYKIQNQWAEESVNQIKATLKILSMGKSSVEAQQLLKNFENLGISIPSKTAQRKSFFKKLASNLRTQTGQKNMIYNGILNSQLYIDYLQTMLKAFNLPDEILAVAFLESSFNVNAVSKVGASGIWQFMPYMANLFMPTITSNLDYRGNPVISSLAAFHLMAHNKKLLKKWDLVIPAYNSGTKHILMARKKFKSVKNFDLEYMLKHYNHPHVGFASKNFYSEFLALTHALKYQETFFNLQGSSIQRPFNSNNIKIYISRCRFKLPKLAKLYGSTMNDLNPQFDPKATYEAGKIIVADTALPNAYFFQLPQKTIVEKYPKNWAESVTIKKCSLL